MIPSAILGRYARSLSDIVFEEKQEPGVTADLKTYREIFNAVPGILEAFHTPAMPRDAKEKLLNEIIARYPVNPVTSNFLRVLLRHNRIRFFAQIFEIYLKSVNERKGILSARMTVATPLSEQEVAHLAERLAAVTGKIVNIELQLDAEILGGVIVQVGSKVYDGSVRTKLSEMKRRLSEI